MPRRAEPEGADAGGGVPGNVLVPESQVDVVGVALAARGRLRLPVPVVGSSPSPGVVQLVGLPVWLWVERSIWVSRSATAAVPGVAVSVTATPVELVWRMGDGSEPVRCAGPGTPFPVGGDPAAASPDCGHVFASSSAGRSGDGFGASVQVVWEVRWSGGRLPPLTSEAATVFRVAESQALVTAVGTDGMVGTGAKADGEGEGWS